MCAYTKLRQSSIFSIFSHVHHQIKLPPGGFEENFNLTCCNFWKKKKKKKKKTKTKNKQKWTIFHDTSPTDLISVIENVFLLSIFKIQVKYHIFLYRNQNSWVFFDNSFITVAKNYMDKVYAIFAMANMNLCE